MNNNINKVPNNDLRVGPTEVHSCSEWYTPNIAGLRAKGYETAPSYCRELGFDFRWNLFSVTGRNGHYDSDGDIECMRTLLCCIAIELAKYIETCAHVCMYVCIYEW